MICLTLQGKLAECALLVYRTPAEDVRALVPPPLELMAMRHDGIDYAFWAIVVCRVEAMRPIGVPSVFGIDYTHVAHRLYVRTPGAATHGLYFLRSDVDSRLIAAGDFCTDFRMHYAAIDLSISPSRWSLQVRGEPDAHADLVLDRARPFTPDRSIFPSVADALAQLKYSPQGLAPARRKMQVRLAEVLRHEPDWRETPAYVESARFALMDRFCPHAVLELATVVDPIDYRWRLGRQSAVRATPTSAPAARR